MDIQQESFTKDFGNDDMPPAEDGVERIDPKHESLSQCLVNIHCKVRDINLGFQKNAKKFNYITPRDFLDFINHFVDLV